MEEEHAIYDKYEGMVTVFSDRIEILSRGTLPKEQTYFYSFISVKKQEEESLKLQKNTEKRHLSLERIPLL